MNTKFLKESTTKFSSNWLNKRIIFISLLHLLKNYLIRWVPATELASILKKPNRNLKQQLKSNLMSSDIITWKPSTPSTWKHHILRKTNLLHPLNNHPLISSNGHSYNHIKNIHVHHNSPNIYLHKSWRQHYTSTSKMLGFHLIHIIPIHINKQELPGIKIAQINRLLYITIFIPPNTNPKSDAAKKLPSILNIPSNSYCQRYNYSLINITKIKCQNYQFNKHWEWIWPSWCCCICHEYSTCSTWTQITIPHNFILPCKRVTPPLLPRLSSSIKNQKLYAEW